MQCNDRWCGESSPHATTFEARFGCRSSGENAVKIAVQLQPASGAPAAVAYTWDADTEILSARLSAGDGGEGLSGSVGLEGTDGSWLVLDVAAGRIGGVEVAVWPEMRELPRLDPPPSVEDASVVLPALQTAAKGELAALEMATQLTAETDQGQRNIHFRLGRPRRARTVRVARDLLLDVDESSQLSGLWLLNVPPCPDDT
jgi:hypothetical protein